MNRWIRRMDGQMARWADRWLNVRKDGWTERMKGRIGVWMEGQMNG